MPYQKFQYLTYMNDVHIKVFKKAIKANGETMDVDTINLFGFTLLDNISEMGWELYTRSS